MDVNKNKRGELQLLEAAVFVAKIRLGGAAEREAAGRNLPADENEDVEEEAWIDLMKLGSVFSHEGSNLYLRLWQLGQSLYFIIIIIIIIIIESQCD